MDTLKSYIGLYENAISPSLCDNYIEDSKTFLWELIPWTTYKNFEFTSVDVSEYNQGERCNDIPTKYKLSLSPIIEKFAKIYMEDTSAQFTIGGFSKILLNRYPIGSSCQKHVDHIHSLFDGNRKGIPSLSIVGLMNDDFEGGEFVFWDNYVVPLKKGSIVIFPSNFLYSHKVNRITKGTRFSLVTWVW